MSGAKLERWSGPAGIAWCPEHGLHGARSECFECGKPVEQIPMVPLAEVEPLIATLKAIATDTENGPEELGGLAQSAVDAWAIHWSSEDPPSDETVERLADSLRNLEWAQSCSPAGPARDSEEWARMRITALWPAFLHELLFCPAGELKDHDHGE